MPATVQVKFVVSDAEGLAKLSNWKNQVQSLGNAGGAPLSFGGGFAQLGREAERGSALTQKFRETIHTLHPVLESAGLQMGLLGGLARAAGGGVAALAAATIGTGVVALAKLADQAIIVRKRISDVLGSSALGNDVFAKLQERAKSSGTDVSALARPLEDLQLASRAGSSIRGVPGQGQALPGAQNVNRQIDGLTALFQTMRTGAASEEEATKGLEQFTDALRAQAEEGKKAQLTVKMVADLARVAPGAANALAQAFNRRDAQDLEASLRTIPVTIDQLVLALSRMAGPAAAAFNDPAKHIKTFTDALGDVKHEFDNLVKSLTGDDLSGFMAKQMEGVRAGIQATEKDIDALIKIWQKLKEIVTLPSVPNEGAAIFGTPPEKATFKERWWPEPAGAAPPSGGPGGSSVSGLPAHGYGPAPYKDIDPILLKNGLIPLGKMLEYQGFTQNRSGAWEQNAVPRGWGDPLSVRRNLQGIENYKRSFGLGGAGDGSGGAPGLYRGPPPIVIPRHAPAAQPSAQHSTELMQPITLTLDGRVIADAMARIAVRDKRTSTGDKGDSW